MRSLKKINIVVVELRGTEKNKNKHFLLYPSDDDNNNNINKIIVLYSIIIILE